MARLDELSVANGGVFSSAEIDAGFEFEGETITFRNRQRGIWRPRQLQQPGAALSITTAPPIQGRVPAYDDEVAHDERGWFGYRYQGTDPDDWDNQALRAAFQLRRPIIYFYGLSRGRYAAMYPAYVRTDDRERLTFGVEVDVPLSVLDPARSSQDIGSSRREYQTVVAKKRLHQGRFRELVLDAYSRRCTMCRLGHVRLLDAAHIIPDRDDRGLPLVSNGLALCKIHHSAYDQNILGISPDLIVHVRLDILREVDGPMLEHGLKAMKSQKIHVPRSVELKPDRDSLAERFAKFQAA